MRGQVLVVLLPLILLGCCWIDPLPPGATQPPQGSQGRSSPPQASQPVRPPTKRAPALALAGPATWYRWHTGEAAAGPGLRHWLGSSWRGRRVRVCAGRCIVVKLTDWCACGQGRLIDLDARAFQHLAPLSRGVIRVQVGRL